MECVLVEVDSFDFFYVVFLAVLFSEKVRTRFRKVRLSNCLGLGRQEFQGIPRFGVLHQFARISILGTIKPRPKTFN